MLFQLNNLQTVKNPKHTIKISRTANVNRAGEHDEPAGRGEVRKEDSHLRQQGSTPRCQNAEESDPGLATCHPHLSAATH